MTTTEVPPEAAYVQPTVIDMAPFEQSTSTTTYVVEEEPTEPVDQVRAPKPTAFSRITAAREGSKQPVVVDWVRKPEERNAIIFWAIGYAWHVFMFHLVRVPEYQFKLTYRAPLGLYRTIRAATNAVFDAEGKPLRLAAVIGNDSAEYLKLVKERNARVKARSLAATCLAVPLIVGAVFTSWFMAEWQTYAVGVLLIDVFGYIGRSKLVPLISKATTPLHVSPVLRQESVELALRSIGISALKSAVKIEFPDPIVKEGGSGWLARVNLPLGVTPEAVMGKRAELASGLRRPLGCVWPEAGTDEHGGLLKLFVSFTDLASMRQPEYPLFKGQADLFRKLPFGTNNRGNKVGICLFEQNLLIGALPGAGKTSVVRCLAAGASLDPTAEIHVWELFGKGDLSCMEKVAHRYGSGMDRETLDACVADLREILADIERRAGVLKKLTKEAREMVPDAKTTRQLADKKSFGMHPVVVFLDEVQNLYQHEDYGKDAEKIVMDIIRMGRAVGVILVQSTQRPDANSLPKAISANAGIRIGLRMMGWSESDMILGTGMNQKGITSVQFGQRDRGCAWLVGVGDGDPFVARSYYLSTVDAERVTVRARQLRQAAGRLSGYAAGELDTDPGDSLLYNLAGDVRRVLVEAGDTWAWSEDIIARLAKLRPDHYREWTPEILAKSLSPYGVETKQINRMGPEGVRRNLMGVDLDQLEEALKIRNSGK